MIVLHSLLLGGCAGIYGLVAFEVLEPATVEIPAPAERFLILNRAPSGPPTWFEDNRKNLTRSHYHYLDTLIVGSLRRGFLDELELSPMSESFRDPAYLAKRTTDSIPVIRPLSPEIVSGLCRENDCDFILSLESFYTHIDQEREYIPDAYMVWSLLYVASNKLEWKIYRPGLDSVYTSFSSTDTVYYPEIWEGEYQGGFRGTDIVLELYTRSGSRCAASLVPIWSRKERLIFKRGHETLRAAAKLTSEGDWDGAFAQWQDLSADTDSSAAGMAMHNMAVYYELEDRLDSCQVLLERALEKAPELELTQAYLEDVEIRILNKQDIIRQIR